MEWSATKVTISRVRRNLLGQTLLIYIVITNNSGGRQQPKASLAESETINHLHKRDKQGPAKEHHGEMSKYNSTFFITSSKRIANKSGCGHALGHI